jgi:hypothetical protein
MITYAYLRVSTNPKKKYMITVNSHVNLQDNKTIHFGARGYQDYTSHKDPERQRRYINRHKERENWSVSGINTAGFWSRWLLWNKPSIDESMRDIQRRFNVVVIRD